MYDPSDRLLNSSFLQNLFAYKITNENFDMKDKRGHYLMTIERSYKSRKKKKEPKELTMIKQSNMKFDLELSRNQSMENNYICQRFAIR